MSRALSLTITGLLAAVTGTAAHAQVTPENFTIAFIGDQGLGSNAVAVLNLIADEGADAVIHSGDFDYDDNPAAWDAQIDSVLGPDFPYFATIGNHDADKFFVAGGYQQRIAARMQRLGIAWQGNLGVRCTISYQGIFIVMTDPGIFELNDPTHVDENYLRASLAADHSMWRISSWHKCMRAMQVGDKDDETGWGVYEAARRGGAIIATAHEHSYERTHLLSSCQNQTVAYTGGMLQLVRDDPATSADEGRSFVFVSGLGGKSIRDQSRCPPLSPPYGCLGEWAEIATSDQGAHYGALFAQFNFLGVTNLCHFYFKDVSGTVRDEFFALAAEDICTGDVDGSGAINVVDLLSLLGSWGSSTPGNDANGDGLVNIVDLLLMLAGWGPCP